jgi:uncharacterized delta-60 repeat protein
MNYVASFHCSIMRRLIAIGTFVFPTVCGVLVDTPDAHGQALAADARSRVVLATAGATARYRADGALDPTFGVNGVAAVSVGGLWQRPGVDVSPGGTIVLAACAFSDATGVVFDVVRLTTNGTLDPAFHSDGVDDTDSNAECFTQVILLPDAKILVAGYWLTFEGARDFTVARYHRDGSLDDAFGAGGRLVSDLPLARIAVTPQGDIVALAIRESAYREDLVLTRFTRDGELDADFGSGGVLNLTLPVPAYFEHIALTHDGRIVLGGSVAPREEEPYAAIARLSRAGELDPTFGTDGIVATRISYPEDLVHVSAIGVEPNGTVYAAGFTFGRPYAPHERRLVLMRFDRRGRQDLSFGTNGFFLRPTDGANATLALLPGRSVILGGYDNAGQYLLTRVRPRPRATAPESSW